MRLPKTVQISGKQYSIKQNSNRWGGRCRLSSQEIVVGAKKDQSSQRIFTNYIHEVLEAISFEKDFTYRATDDEVVIVMTHKQFDDYSKDVATALWPIVKQKLLPPI